MNDFKNKGGNNELEYPDKEKLYDDLREKWKHEDNLINQRVTWLLNSQAFLLAAYGVFINFRLEHTANLNISNTNYWKDQFYSPYNMIEIILVISGIFVMFFLVKGIAAATVFSYTNLKGYLTLMSYLLLKETKLYYLNLAVLFQG